MWLHRLKGPQGVAQHTPCAEAQFQLSKTWYFPEDLAINRANELLTHKSSKTRQIYWKWKFWTNLCQNFQYHVPVFQTVPIFSRISISSFFSLSAAAVLEIIKKRHYDVFVHAHAHAHMLAGFTFFFFISIKTIWFLFHRHMLLLLLVQCQPVSLLSFST